MYTSRTLFPSLRVVGENRTYNIRDNMNSPIPMTAPYSAFLSSSALTVTGQRVKIAMTMANAKEKVETSLPALEREVRDGLRRMAILKRMEKMAGSRKRSYNFFEKDTSQLPRSGVYQRQLGLTLPEFQSRIDRVATWN